jgi:radical SAM superfamily enzyme YgiQ (UPF0313 family)
MNPKLIRTLANVQKPARYTGGEYGRIMKNPDEVSVRVALAFPDIYEIGMSNLGFRILYGAINTLDGVWCQRVFEPWADMSQAMRESGIPLYALESGDPVAEFDMIGFSVGYEMSYPGILNMLDLMGLPLRSADRKSLSPVVFAGGTCMFNPEPIADFIDLAVIGEGEELDIELIECYRSAKERGLEKEEFLLEAAKIPGVYVPSLYTVTYHQDGTIKSVLPKNGAPAKVTKRSLRIWTARFTRKRDCALDGDRA